MSENKEVSIREYARELGINHSAVSYAIKSGKIDKGYNSKTKKIIPDIANREYGYDLKIRKINEKITEEVTEQNLDTYRNLSIEDIQIKASDTVSEATRKQTIIKAQTDLLKLKTMSSELVNKDEVYKDMFAFGKEIRMNLQAIPDRIIDQLITLDRNAAHLMLTESINQALTKLSDNVN